MLLGLFLVLMFQTSTPPTPAAPKIPHRQVPPEKSWMTARATHKNVYPCKMVGDWNVLVHEKGGYSTIYDMMPPPPDAEVAKIKAIPDCKDAAERDGK